MIQKGDHRFLDVAGAQIQIALAHCMHFNPDEIALVGLGVDG
ncbi:MAG: hypothetical protein ACRC2U_00805 [Aeromonas sp.]